MVYVVCAVVLCVLQQCGAGPLKQQRLDNDNARGAANLAAKPQVHNAHDAAQSANVAAKTQVVEATVAPPLANVEARPQLVHPALVGAGSAKAVEYLQEKPYVVHTSFSESSHLPAKPQVVHTQPDSFGNLDEKPQVVHRTGSVGTENVKPKPQLVHGRRLPGLPKDKTSFVQERPQIPPTAPISPRPYGEKTAVAQVPPFPPKPIPPMQEKPQIPMAQRPKPEPFLAAPLLRLPGGFPFGRVQVPPTRPPPACYYKGERYEQGDSVPTAEPCLNCTCQRGVLACFLRVCPVLGTQTPGCFSAREAGECCPKVYCSAAAKPETTTYAEYPDLDYDNVYASAEEELSARTPPVPLDLLPETETTSPQENVHRTTQEMSTEALTTTTPTEQPQTTASTATTELKEVAGEDLSDANRVDEDRGKDSVMFVSSTPLPDEDSFHLHDLNSISGALNHTTTTTQTTASPATSTSSTTPSTTTTTTTKTSTTSSAAPVTIPIQGCWKKGQLYRVGEAIPSGTDCEACYCSPSGPTCHRIECPQVALDCEPIIQKGHCCPTKYICNKTTPGEDRKPVFEVFSSKVSRDQQLRKSDVIEPRDSVVDTSPTTTLTTTPITTTTTTTEAQTETSHATTVTTFDNVAKSDLPPTQKQHVIYVPELLRTQSGGKMMTELKIVMNPSSKENNQDEQALYRRQPAKEDQQSLPAVPLEGLQFSELIDRLFFTNREDSTELSQQNEKLQPVYSEPQLSNATNAFVVETRYPVRENDTLRPIYGDPLEAKYGNSAPVVVDATDTVTESAPRYETAVPIEFNATSAGPVYAIALAEDADANAVIGQAGVSSEPFNHDDQMLKGNLTIQLHMPEGESVDGNQSSSGISSESRDSELATEMPTENSTKSFASASLVRSDEDREAYVTTTNSPVSISNAPLSEITVTPTESPVTALVTDITTADNRSDAGFTKLTPPTPYLANEVNMTAVSSKGSKVTTNTTTEDTLTTKVIKVKVGNVLNVTDGDIGSPSAGRPRLRNIDEDGLIVATSHGDHLSDSSELFPESRAIDSDGPVSNVHRLADKVKSFLRPEKLWKGDSEPELITAPNVDFSDGDSIAISVSPSNSFKVSVGFGGSSNMTRQSDVVERKTVNMTAPPVDTAPWAPLSNRSSEENVTSATTLAEHQVHETTEESKRHSVVHSSFRIVPFLAEDAIFKPADAGQNQTHHATVIRVKSNPREPVKDNCFIGGRMFVNGELIKKSDPCDLCRCYYGEELCQKKTCPPPPSPACFTERVTGFCCPKYTCRPEDVGFPTNKQKEVVTTTTPTTTTRRTEDGTTATTQKTSDSSFLRKVPFLKNFFSRTSSTWTPIKVSETTTTATWRPETRPTTTTALDHGTSFSAWNVLQVSGCNIYGRLYSVNEVIRELSSGCKACTCTALGVQCNSVC